LSIRPITLAVFALAIALIVVGCGGGGSSSSDGSSSTSGSDGSSSSSEGGGGASSISKAEFIKEADGVCTAGKKQVESEYAAYLKKKGIKEINPKTSSRPEAEAQATEVIETIAIPALRKQLDTIKALGVPDGDEQVSGYVAAVEKGIKEGEGEPVALFASADKVFAEADKLADEIGFKVCGQR